MSHDIITLVIVVKYYVQKMKHASVLSVSRRSIKTKEKVRHVEKFQILSTVNG